MTPYLPALAGGLLIGHAATIFLIADGRGGRQRHR